MRNRKINTHENRCKESRERERISSTNRNIKIEKHKDVESQKIKASTNRLRQCGRMDNTYQTPKIKTKAQNHKHKVVVSSVDLYC